MKKMAFVLTSAALLMLGTLTATAQTTTPKDTKQAQTEIKKQERKSGDAGMVKSEKREMKSAERKEMKAAKKGTQSVTKPRKTTSAKKAERAPAAPAPKGTKSGSTPKPVQKK